MKPVFAARRAPVRAVADAAITEVDRVDAFDGDHDLGGRTVSDVTGSDGRWYAANLSPASAAPATGQARRHGVGSA